MGQVVVRAGCWLILAATIIVGPKPILISARPVFILLLAIISLPLLQLVPLPPTWWQVLPGREVLLIPGETLPPWRPWTTTPGATRNALSSLVVPVTMFVLLTQSSQRGRAWLPAILVVMISSAVLLGLLQFSGAGFNSPLINDPPGDITSIFANRNHFALLIAVGCIVVPVWAVLEGGDLKWRGPLALGLLVLFILTILATGSRSGMLLAALSLIFAFALVSRRLKRKLSHAPTWAFPVFLGVIVLLVVAFVSLSFLYNRADGINRLIELDSADDLRFRALPTVLNMISIYMPFGTGFGGFDPIFRIHEPDEMLSFHYFNQAHNDFLGLAFAGGVPAILLLAIALLWWLMTTIRVWCAEADNAVVLGRSGSAIMLIVFLASFTDYPARTPTIMAILVIAAWWLGSGLIGRSQKMTVAASVMGKKKVVGHRS